MPKRTECSKCGSIYDIFKHHCPMRDQDTLACEVCGETLRSWNGGVYYSLSLIERHERHSKSSKSP